MNQKASLDEQASDGDKSCAEGLAETVESLKLKVLSSLRHQGFDVDEGGIKAPISDDKDSLRSLHAAAVKHRVNQGAVLRSKEPSLIDRIASGDEVDPNLISPRLIEVRPNSFDAMLFRYATLHWSIPVSSGYGRRVRFLVVDQHNGKLIGIIGLGDPVFGLGVRDRWVGWDADQRNTRLRHVLDAYVLGAVPPYSNLLCGKLVAMLTASNEVRSAFERKYTNRAALISEIKGDSRVALLTTTSALGRSSIYNRIRFRNRLLYTPVGYTLGFGEFQFANGIYKELLHFAETHCQPTAKNARWGKGFRSRREVIRKALTELGLPAGLNRHGVRRQLYVIPLARHVRSFLRGETHQLDYYDQNAGDLFAHFRERWLLPRAKRTQTYRKFDRKSFLLWNGPSPILAT